MLRFRSVSNIVIAPARTGSDRRSKIVVTRAAQINRVDLDVGLHFDRIFLMVAIKLADPKIELTPAK